MRTAGNVVPLPIDAVQSAIVRVLERAARTGKSVGEKWLRHDELYRLVPECDSPESMVVTLAQMRRASLVQRVSTCRGSGSGHYIYAAPEVIEIPTQRPSVPAPTVRAANPNRTPRRYTCDSRYAGRVDGGDVVVTGIDGFFLRLPMATARALGAAIGRALKQGARG